MLAQLKTVVLIKKAINFLEGQHRVVASSLLLLRLVLCRYYLMKLPVEDL
jgi:hypothetical protein